MHLHGLESNMTPLALEESINYGDQNNNKTGLTILQVYVSTYYKQNYQL